MIMALAVGLTVTACQKVSLDADSEEDVIEQTAKTKKFTFTCKGDFSNEWKPVTRGYLQADGRDLTDVWVLDYMDGNLIQQLHQTDNTAEDFGKPVMQLKYGNHHVYLIASRGQSPTIDTENHTITFAKVYDTFYKDYEVNVVSTSNGNRAVTLDRHITKLRLEFTDAVPDGTGSINVTPAVWYYGFDYVTGEPCAAANNQTIVINVPASTYGMTGQGANVFGFSTAEQWTTNISFNSKNTNGDIIGQATIEDAPFKRNRVTCYTGPLFGSSGSMTLSLNDSWSPQYDGVW